MRAPVDSTIPKTSKLAYRFFFFINIFVLQHFRDTKPSTVFMIFISGRSYLGMEIQYVTIQNHILDTLY